MKNNLSVETEFKKIVNLKARNITLGHGSFLTIDFGEDIKEEHKTKGQSKVYTRGEWFLWLYMCFWRIEYHNKLIVGSEDKREEIELATTLINNQKLIFFNISPFNDLELDFESGHKIRTFSAGIDYSEQWKLSLSNGMTFVANSSGKFEYRE